MATFIFLEDRFGQSKKFHPPGSGKTWAFLVIWAFLHSFPHCQEDADDKDSLCAFCDHSGVGVLIAVGKRVHFWWFEHFWWIWTNFVFLCEMLPNLEIFCLDLSNIWSFLARFGQFVHYFRDWSDPDAYCNGKTYFS